MRLVIFWALAGVAHAGGVVASGAAHEVVHVGAPADPVRGPRRAVVTLDVYVAIGHAPSSNVSGLARRAVERAHVAGLDDVREVLHLQPTGMAGADLALEAALEADAQGRFWPFADRILAERNPAALQRVELLRLGRDLDLDLARLDAALSSTVRKAKPFDPKQQPQAGRILINGRPLSGWPTDDALQAAIETAREHAQGLLADGVPLGRLYDTVMEEVRAENEPPRFPRVKRPRMAVDLTHSPARGPSLAPITIVVYANLLYAPCRDLALLVRRVAEKRPSQVRVVWKHWAPPYSDTSALELAAAAERQGRFWALHDAVIDTRRPWSLSSMEEASRKIGLDAARVRDDQRAGILRARVERDLDEERRLRILYAPSLLVNGLVVAGPPTQDALERLIEDELDRGLAERLAEPTTTP